MEFKNREVYEDAIKKWGEYMQTQMAIEECAELIDALCKSNRGRNNKKDVLNEMVDVYIMIEQLFVLYDFSIEEFREQFKYKIDRLKKLLVKD